MSKKTIVVKRLTQKDSIAFNRICDWHYNWFGKRDNKPYEEIEENLLHSLNTRKQLPQTFVAWIDNKPVGTYQFAMMDDIDSRPDIYPWLISVYVEENHRGKGVLKTMMETVQKNAKKAGLDHLYLYTSHKNLYDKFGWKYIGPIKTYRKKTPLEKLYFLKIK